MFHCTGDVSANFKQDLALNRLGEGSYARSGMRQSQ